MDLLVFGRVLWRFRLIVAAGIVLGAALAILAIARVDYRDGGFRFEYRAPEVWRASTTLLLTQPGFPWGSTGGAGDGAAPIAIDPSRLTYLALFYSRLANSDVVQRRVLLGESPLVGSMEAVPVTDAVDNKALPFVSIIGIATSPHDAVAIATRGAEVFTEYVARSQADARTPAAQRVGLEIVNAAQAAELVEPRKRTTPVFVFLAVLTAVLGLVFLLENIRPRLKSPATSPAVVLPARGGAESVEEAAR